MNLEHTLGTLRPLYEEYSAIVAQIDPDTTQQVTWRPEVANDELHKALKGLHGELTAEDFTKAIEISKYTKY